MQFSQQVDDDYNNYITKSIACAWMYCNGELRNTQHTLWWHENTLILYFLINRSRHVVASINKLTNAVT